MQLNLESFIVRSYMIRQGTTSAIRWRAGRELAKCCTQAVVAEGPLVMPEEKKLKLPTKYCESIHQTIRRPTRTIHIGKVETGSAHPVRLQTMTTTGEPSPGRSS